MENNQDTRQRFAALIREHSHSMFRAARAILDCDADAEDAVGEAVLLAWQALPKLKNQAAARRWLLKITVNCAYGQRRSQQRVVYMDDLSQAAGSAPLPEPSGLWDAVLRLPEDQRLAVMFYYYEDDAGGGDRQDFGGCPGNGKIPAEPRAGTSESAAARGGSIWILIGRTLTPK